MSAKMFSNQPIQCRIIAAGLVRVQQGSSRVINPTVNTDEGEILKVSGLCSEYLSCCLLNRNFSKSI